MGGIASHHRIKNQEWRIKGGRKGGDRRSTEKKRAPYLCWSAAVAAVTAHMAHEPGFASASVGVAWG